MQTIALIGQSGSGKSHRALLVAHEYDVDIIIDDGLAIKGSKILAGTSAKKQTTRVGAIKTALFNCEEHAKQVANAIKENGAQNILVLGTSAGMVRRIVQRLDLPHPSIELSISDIATENEIKQAQLTRKKFGKHVIPAPTVAVKSRFPDFIVDPLQALFHRNIKTNSRFNKPLRVEQAVVRPNFNYLGKFFIADSALRDIIKLSINQSGLPVKINRIEVINTMEGIILNIELSIKYHDVLFTKIAKEVQLSVYKVVEQMTAMNIININIIVKSLYLE
ncbi:MAG: Asp23/Gls24 family envelope stress response protein [Bacillota bacterium]